MKHDLISIGGATEDITFYTKEGILMDNKKDVLRQKLICFEYGAKIKVDKSRATFGGGAANVAVSASRLGLKSAALATLGNDDRGKRIRDNFLKEGVDAGFLQYSRNKETGFSFLITGQENEHVVFSNRAANDELKIMNYELRILGKAKWIYITSLSGEWQDALKKIFKAEGPKIVWNPGHRQLLKGYKTLGKYLKKTEALIVNKDEAIELVKSCGDFASKGGAFLNDMNNLLGVISSWGPKIVVITNGKHGASVRAGNENYYQKILKEKKRINTAGVGDAFGSSFIAGLEIYAGNIKKAMFLGVKNTASVVGHYGAQTGLIKRKDLK
ncbi:MAG: PfkB family carbohydrate kinase [Patescibacteria group bacterium]|jgi:sugar/nucleoside kinase (ribokinase family)